MTLYRYIARRFLLAFAAVWAGVAVVVLIVDFADRARSYRGERMVAAVAELYALKAVEVFYLLAPTALIIGAAIAVSALRRRNETVAMAALGLAPRSIVAPIAAVAAAVGALMWAAEDRLVAPAARRAEQIAVERFDLYGDWAAWNEPRRWVRGEGRLYHLGELEGGGFRAVTVLELAETEPFRLERRIDAERMEPLSAPGGAWRLVDVTVREFDEKGAMRETRVEERVERFAEEPDAFRLKAGRPESLDARDLREQVEVRRRRGLPSRPWELALHQKAAMPSASVPAAALGALLALRPRRRGGLALALAEGIGVTVVLAALAQVARTLALAGAMPAAVAAWAPFAALVALAAAVRMWK